MRTSKRKSNKYNFDRANLDKRVDQFFEVGKQFVDGVSGTRPGSRKKSSLREFSRRNVKNVGNWVSNKMDSFFEDDYEDWEDDNVDEFKSFTRNSDDREYLSFPKKRPLEAVSLRSRNILNEQKRLSPSNDISNKEWEDDSFFQINKWKRSSDQFEDQNFDQQSQARSAKVRNFPRSRRRRT